MILTKAVHKNCFSIDIDKENNYANWNKGETVEIKVTEEDFLYKSTSTSKQIQFKKIKGNINLRRIRYSEKAVMPYSFWEV